MKTILLLSFKFLFLSLSLFKLSFHANIPHGKYFFSNFFLSGYTVNGCVPYTHILILETSYCIYLKIELAFLDYYPTRRRKNKCPILNLLKTILFYAIKNFFSFSVFSTVISSKTFYVKQKMCLPWFSINEVITLPTALILITPDALLKDTYWALHTHDKWRKVLPPELELPKMSTASPIQFQLWFPLRSTLKDMIRRFR